MYSEIYLSDIDLTSYLKTQAPLVQTFYQTFFKEGIEEKPIYVSLMTLGFGRRRKQMIRHDSQYRDSNAWTQRARKKAVQCFSRLSWPILNLRVSNSQVDEVGFALNGFNKSWKSSPTRLHQHSIRWRLRWIDDEDSWSIFVRESPRTSWPNHVGQMWQLSFRVWKPCVSLYHVYVSLTTNSWRLFGIRMLQCHV